MAGTLIHGVEKRPPKPPEPKFRPVLLGTMAKKKDIPKMVKNRIPQKGTAEQALIKKMKKEHVAKLAKEVSDVL
jgi:hypothetical protein